VAGREHLAAALASRAGAFLTPLGVTDLPAPTLQCRDPRRALVTVLELFHPSAAPTPGVDPSARVAPEARIDPTASIGPLAVVEAGASIGPRVRVGALVYVASGVEIGDDSVLFPHVVIYEGSRVGRRVIVHAGAVIGADGFGFIPGRDGHLKIPQVGGVTIEDDVEIGANSTIDRATLGQTVIGRGTKLDNLVQIGHNVTVGERCLMAAQVGIAGSTRVGNGVAMGGQVGLADHVDVGDEVVIAAQSGVIQDVAPRSRIAGTWARPVALTHRIWVAQAELPELVRTVQRLEDRLAKLEARLGSRE
jgi:UDP-3-O-[3-hydroxymyristoyl] glucosamine N-acyltransferase